MKRLLALLLCLLIIAGLAACELPDDRDFPTLPSSSIPDSSVPGSSAPGVSVPGTSVPASSAPGTSVPGSTPPAASVPGTTPPASAPTSPTAPSTGPAPKPSPNPDPGEDEKDYREDFMAVHNAGQKFSFALGLDAYEISLNADTGICTVWHKQKVQETSAFDLGPIAYSANSLLTYYRNYYYIGAYQPGADGKFKVTFDRYYLDVDLQTLSRSTIAAIREYVWDNLEDSQWQQDYYLTKAECEMWDALLDGKAVKDIRRWIDTMELSGSTSLPLQLLYTFSSGEQYQSFTLTDTQIKYTSYYYGGGYCDRVYDPDGNSLYWYEQDSNGSSSRTEFDAQGHISYSIHKSADGSYTETTVQWNGDIRTSTTSYFVVDKVDGLYCDRRTISVYRYYQDGSSMEIPISSHTYDRNGELISYALYTEAGLPLETFYPNSLYKTLHTLYIYEGNRLLKTVATDAENNVTTSEYIYENGQLITLRCTRQYANGDIEQWEQAPPAAPDTPPN
ncbi:MAG: hypothetical protein E7447_06995 [Ruminococcaceae bacterium]|nr:hypothetical protein [Oscillospiraceae bacterium]